MRTLRSRLLLAVLALTPAVFLGAACTNFYEQYYLPLTEGAGGSGGTGGTGGSDPGCIPNQTGGPIDDGCGFFVSASSGDDAHDGKSKDQAVATLGQAILLAQGKRIYACADETKAFDEALTIDGTAQIFGGLDCTTWQYVAGTKTKWIAPADEVPLRVSDDASVTMTDIAIEAANAAKDGGSSIAIVAQAGATLELSRCDVEAGNAKDGATPSAPLGSGMTGVPGDAGLDGCVDVTSKVGGNGGQRTCGALDVSGGLGGTGTASNTGGDGSKGQPSMGTTGSAGLGQGVAVSCDIDGKGGDGAEGMPGDPGSGATGDGALSSDGFTGDPGKGDGTPGKAGQGGGGGGGAKKCAANAGPSAGGGGSGGCGGAPGKGGQAGGASIGIVSLGATLALSDVKIVTKNGGRGGDGGPGQPGGDGGDGGSPGTGDATSIACAGGKGGKGGPGGRGGGGRGGHSIGIAHTGSPPDIKEANITVGAPGEGGTGDGISGTGALGVAQPTLGF